MRNADHQLQLAALLIGGERIAFRRTGEAALRAQCEPFERHDPRAPLLVAGDFNVAPTDLDELAASGEFEVLDGPITRFGARGSGASLYIRDPDGTTIELRHYA